VLTSGISSPLAWISKSKGCDAVDPDNVNGFGNDTGFSLSKADVVDYLKFLAEAAHSLGMAIGLKNAGDIVPQLVDQFHFAVNPQCHNYSECGLTRPFITAGNPVFHTEYPDGAPNVDARLKTPSATTHLPGDSRRC